jgi:Ca2+-binding RTX toxin-like protein
MKTGFTSIGRKWRARALVISSFAFLSAFAGVSGASGGAASPTADRAGGAAECQGEKATIVGTHGDDVLTGTKRRDVIQAGVGNDVIRGRGGNDLICGHKGDDRIFGGEGND